MLGLKFDKLYKSANPYFLQKNPLSVDRHLLLSVFCDVIHCQQRQRWHKAILTILPTPAA